VKSGIIILSELRGPLRELVLDIQRRFDPKLAAGVPPHVTITGSSGMGPISTHTTQDELRSALEPVARETEPMTLRFKRPIRFMQTNVVVLPLDPNGPIRALHERIKTSGLVFEHPRFTFTPHVTLSFFRELTPDDARALLAVRVDEPVTIDHISAHRTVDITNSKKLLELPLGDAGDRNLPVRKTSSSNRGVRKSR
jgi:2'-5' RNA ligase